MSRINNSLVCNFTYNKRSVKHIIFSLENKHALTIAENGAGKTVMSNLLLTPFLWGLRNDTTVAERSMEKILDFVRDNNGPTIVGHEFSLDKKEEGYLSIILVMEPNNEKGDIDKFVFVSTYKNLNSDISLENFPILDECGRVKKVRTIYETVKNKPNVKVFGNRVEKRYKDFKEYLSQYNICLEQIALGSRVLNSEGGLANMFKDETDFAGFFIKYIFPSVMSNAIFSNGMETSAIEELKENVIKQIENEKTNADKLKCLDETKKYVEALEIVKELAAKREIANSEFEIAQYSHIKAIEVLDELINGLDEEIEELRNENEENDRSITKIKMDKLSFEIKELEKEMASSRIEYIELRDKINKLEDEKNRLDKNINCYDAKNLFIEILDLTARVNTMRSKIDNNNAVEKQREKLTELGRFLYCYYSSLVRDLKSKIAKIEKEVSEVDSKIEKAKKEKSESQKVFRENEDEIVLARVKIEIFDKNLSQYSSKYPSYKIPNKSALLANNGVKMFVLKINKTLSAKESAKEKELEKLEVYQHELSETSSVISSLENNRNIISKNLLDAISRQKAYTLLKGECLKIIDECGLSKNNMDELDILSSYIFNEQKKCKDDLIRKQISLERRKRYLNRLRNNCSEIDVVLQDILFENSIEYQNGLSYLNAFSKEKKNFIFKNLPAIYYGIIVNDRDYSKLKKFLSGDRISDFCTPVFTYSFVDNLLNNGNSINLMDIHLFASIPDNACEDNFILKEIENIENLISSDEKIISTLSFKSDNLAILFSKINELSKEYGEKYSETIIAEINSLNEKQTVISENINRLNNKREELQSLIKTTEEACNVLDEEILEIVNLITDLNILDDDFKEYKKTYEAYNNFVSTNDEIGKQIETLERSIEELRSLKNSLINDKKDMDTDVIIKSLNINRFSVYFNGQEVNVDGVSLSDVETKEREFLALKETFDDEISKLEEEIKNCNIQIETKSNRIIKEFPDLSEEDYKDFDISTFDKGVEKSKLKEAQKNLSVLNKRFGDVEGRGKTLKEGKEAKEIAFYTLSNGVAIYNVVEYDFDSEIEKLLAAKEYNAGLIGNKENQKTGIFSLRTSSTYQDCQVPRNFRLEEEINVSNYSRKIKEIYQRRNVKYREKEEANTNLLNYVRELKELFKSESILSSISDLLVNIDISTVEKVDRLYNRQKQFIVSTENSIGYIMKERQELIESSKGIAQKLLETTKRLCPVANSIKSRDGKKLIEIKNLKELQGFSENVESFISSLIEEGKKMSLPEIETYIKRNLTGEALFTKYVPLSAISFRLMRMDKNRMESITFEQYARGKASGAQRMILSFVILILLFKFESCDYDYDFSFPLIQDNPFGVSSSEVFIDELFHLADSCNIQLWSWSAHKIPHVMDKHDVVFDYCVKKTTNGSELVEITEIKEREFVSVFSSDLSKNL